MAYLNGFVTIVGMLTFFGIVMWAWSKGRVQANEDAASLPFALPDEADVVNKAGGSNE